MRKVWLAFAIAGLLAVWSSSASAVTLFDNGSAGQDSSAYLSDFDPASGGFMQIVADDFSLPSSSVIGGVHFWGSYLGEDVNSNPGPAAPAQDDFTLDVFAPDATGLLPGSLLSSMTIDSLNRTDTGIDTSFLDLRLYKYDATVADLSLGAGTYFLEIANNTTSDGTAGSWVWEMATDNPLNYNVAAYNNSSPWYEGGGSMAFNLTGDAGAPDAAVPEPATMTLFGLGLAGLVAKVARRRNR